MLDGGGAADAAGTVGVDVVPGLVVFAGRAVDPGTGITQNTAYNIYFKDNEALLYSTLATRVKTKVESIKTGFDSPDNKATEIKGVKKNALRPFLKSGAIKSDAELAELVKKNFISGSFLEATETGIAWPHRSWPPGTQSGE